MKHLFQHSYPYGRKGVSYLVLGLLLVSFSCTMSKKSDETEQERQLLETVGQQWEILNPVLPGDRPDPTVIKIGDTYWASATSNEWAPLFPIFKSKDLLTWELVTYVFPDGAPDWARNNFWAPELSYDEAQNRIYAYYTARDKVSNRLSIAVASAAGPEGPYTDHGPLVAQESGSIDAFEMRDKDGKLYVLWKEDGNSRGLPTPMWAQEINEERTQLIGEMHELFRNDVAWEGGLVEGIAVFLKDDYFYATYSAGVCCDRECNYKTGVARAESLLGPWEKYAHNPVLKDNETWQCAGHGTVIEKDGDYYLLYHAYSAAGSVYVGREGVLEKINWEGGWPVFANNATSNHSRETLNFADDFKTGLNPLWQWRVTQDIQYHTNEEGLFLGASRENGDIGSLLVQPTRSPNYGITVTIDPENSGEKAEGGIALVGAAHNGFGAPIAAMGISVGDNNIKVWQTIDGTTEVLGNVAIADKNDPIDLKMQVSEGHIITFSYKTDNTWNTLISEQDADLLVPWGMGYRLGLVAKGNPAEAVNFNRIELNNL